MNREGSRRDHVQQEVPVTRSAVMSEAPTPSQSDDQSERMPPAVAARYWLVIVIWAIGVAIMVLFELAAAIWRR